MLQIDRTQIPEVHTINSLNLPKIGRHTLKNGIQTHIINIGKQDFVKIDIVFNAGTWHHELPLVALATGKLITEGTYSKTAKEIADFFDFYGAIIINECDKDFSSLSLYCLEKHLAITLPMIQEMLTHATFEQSEIDNFANKGKQTLKIELEKVKTVARREFSAAIFGLEHPYGKKTEVAHYDNVTQTEIRHFYQQKYTPSNCFIIVTGNINPKIIGLLDGTIGKWKRKSTTEPELTFAISPSSQKNIKIQKDDALQTAIRIGLPLFNKQHPDFIPFTVLNTILGGYFGSRLMKNIREDKGYTYGIGCANITHRNEGIFSIVTEVNGDNADAAVAEILKEIALLRNQPVSDHELDVVKNYMTGDILRSINGLFSVSDSYRSVIEFGMDESFFNKALGIIKKITPAEIQRLANQYLIEENLYIVKVGK